MKRKRPSKKPANKKKTGGALVKRRSDGTLMPGFTANPNGRPKVAQHLVLRARKFIEEEGLELAMAEVRRGGDDWVRALTLLTMYGVGKPPDFEHVEAMARAAESDVSSGFDVERLSPGEREAFRGLLVKGYGRVGGTVETATTATAAQPEVKS